MVRPILLWLAGVPTQERLALARVLEPVGYVRVEGELGKVRYDVAVIDARTTPRRALAIVDAVRAEQPKCPFVVLADTNDTFVYQHVARLRRRVVLYSPVSWPHLQDALDRLTSEHPEKRIA
jgi:DNA-binding NarL/FixJ family response regulator